MTPKVRLQEGQEEHKGGRLFKNILKQVRVKAHLLLFLAGAYPAAAAYGQHGASLPWTGPAVAAHDLIMQYRLAEADALLEPLAASPEKAYLLSLRDFMQMIYTEKEEHYKSYLTNVKQRKAWLDSLPENSDWKIFYLADLRLQEALLRIRYGDYLSGLYELWAASGMLSDISTEDTAFVAFNKPRGVINILLGLAPDSYKWVLRIMGLNGSVEEGLKQLQILAQSQTPLAREANFILGYFYLYPLNQPVEGEKHFLREYTIQPTGHLPRLMYATSLSKGNKGADALLVLQHAPESFWRYLPVAHYLLADLYIQKGDYGAARKSYLRFAEQYKGANFKKDAFTKVAITYLLEGNQQLADEWKTKSGSLPKAYTEPDKNAEVILSELHDYPPDLLKARLASDGGYWATAIQHLENYQHHADLRWSAEYSYRKARIHHLTGEFTEALNSYRTTVTQSEGKNWYIGANAALMAGRLLKDHGAHREAAIYFNKALSYENHPYKNSIDQQAKRELQLLGDH